MIFSVVGDYWSPINYQVFEKAAQLQMAGKDVTIVCMGKEQKDIVVAKEYYDISKTGTNFERDGFNEMMQDIKEGNIDCVIVKDLSRLGRNYVEAGSYIERVFPFFNVRFISVNDHYDSFRDDISLLISMSNVYNEFYSRDWQRK